MKSERRVLDSSQLWLCCGRKRWNNGRRNIEMLRGNCFRKEAGCRNDSSTLVGRMRVSAKSVTRRKGQKSTGSAIVENGTELDGRFQMLSESGSAKRQPQRRSGNGKEVSLRIFSVKANGTGITSVLKRWSPRSARAGACQQKVSRATWLPTAPC